MSAGQGTVLHRQPRTAMSLSAETRWSADRANAWWADRGWVCGFNFLPSTAVNFLEMWRGETFDPETIARELGWAATIGFNAVRTNPHYLVWLNDRDGLIERMRWFLDTAAGLGLDTVFVPFDDCGFGGAEPVYGPQPDPIPGVHNSRAVASPGRAAVRDRAQWPGFERYVTDLVATFGQDPRVLMWDLYNEPGNRMIFTPDGYEEDDPALTPHSRDLMLACFDWARAAAPMQPLTVGGWVVPPDDAAADAYDNEIDRLAFAKSDIITFHAYCDRATASEIIDRLARHGRPMMSTEWMARGVGSRFADQLELYRSRNVGCFNWGLVQGRTQTYLPWPQVTETYAVDSIKQAPWFHDVFLPDGTPYDLAETRLIAELTVPVALDQNG